MRTAHGILERPLILAISLLAGFMFLSIPRAALAQPGGTCWRCESPTSGHAGECFDGWPSGYHTCEHSENGCELTEPDCSAQTEDIQEALEIDEERILMLADQAGLSRPHARVAPKLYIAWNCDGEVASVKFVAHLGSFLSLPVEPWAETHSLNQLGPAEGPDR